MVPVRDVDKLVVAVLEELGQVEDDGEDDHGEDADRERLLGHGLIKFDVI